MKVDLKYVTAFTFLSDKTLFSFGGRYESEFQMLSLSIKKPRFRFIKFHRLDTLSEYRSFKIACEEEDVLTALEYADNTQWLSESSQRDRRHSRLNHVLAVAICSNNHKGKLYFLYLDQLNQCTILMSLTCEQLGSPANRR